MRAYDVILIEVVNSTTSPPNSIALKCKIPHDPPHTNSCICFFYIYYQFSTTSCQLLLSPQYQFLSSGPLDHVKNCLTMCSKYWKNAFEKCTYPLWICLKWKLSPTKNMEMWTNLPAIIPWCGLQSEPTVTWIRELNPQIKCQFV